MLSVSVNVAVVAILYFHCKRKSSKYFSLITIIIIVRIALPAPSDHYVWTLVCSHCQDPRKIRRFDYKCNEQNSLRLPSSTVVNFHEISHEIYRKAL